MPTTHIAVRHDLLHPSMPAAAVAKLRARLKNTIGVDLIKRIRILPPLEERLYRALLRVSVAVLDPYPVGTHTQILEALSEGIPIVSAPQLQECTNSHAIGIVTALGKIFVFIHSNLLSLLLFLSCFNLMKSLFNKIVYDIIIFRYRQ